MAFLEVEFSKWRATVRTVWRVECPKVASAIVALIEAVRSNHQLSSKVGSVLAKLLRTRLDSDELFKCCKDLQEEKRNLAGRVEDVAVEKDELAKKVVDLEAWLKELESAPEESKLWAIREREASK